VNAFIMGVCSGGQGGPWPTLDFQTWYKYSRQRLKSAIFWSFFAIFGLFSVPPCWKRLNSAIFRYFFANFLSFFRCPPPPLENFLPTPLAFIDVALGGNHNYLKMGLANNFVLTFYLFCKLLLLFYAN